MNPCACGCGGSTPGVWVSGAHKQRALRFLPCGGKGVVSFERIRPMFEFLWNERQRYASGWGTSITLARDLGFDANTIWKYRHRPPTAVSRKSAMAVVRLVKAHEAALRVETSREEMRVRRAEYRAKAAAQVSERGNGGLLGKGPPAPLGIHVAVSP